MFESRDGPIANFATDDHDLVRIAPSVSQTNHCSTQLSALFVCDVAPTEWCNVFISAHGDLIKLFVPCDMGWPRTCIHCVGSRN